MARTYKDQPGKIRFPEEYPFLDTKERIPYTRVATYVVSGDPFEYQCWYYEERGGVKTKKKRSVDNEWHWLRGEPRWWRNVFERKNRTRIRQHLHNFMVNGDDVINLTRSNGKPDMAYWW